MSERTIQNGYLIAAQSDIENLRARIAALESVVRAADRMKHYVSHLPGCNESLLIGPCDCRLVSAMNAYDTQRAALGEIGEE